MDTLTPAAATAKPELRSAACLDNLLPDPAPLAMAEQKLWSSSARALGRRLPRGSLPMRRALILLGTAALTAAGGYQMYEVLQVGGVTVLEAMVLALYVVLFAWVAFSFTSSLAGFLVLLFRLRDPLGIDGDSPLPPISRPTAMLLPTYNEDPVRITARLRAIWESVEATGAGSTFDWFVLSDTTDPDIWLGEETCVLRLREQVPGCRIYYRHRARNTARKSGNIADWVTRFGASYDHMIILDADSLMSGDTIVRLAAAMERHPAVGLIQTLPLVVNARTAFARLQQFAGRLYGPLIAAGIAWWHGSEGNYWGHNAIIRVRAFAAQAGLPELSGRKPFGGHILSHDFIEAALMRRGGWAIHMAANLRGSYEECPPSLLDFAARDRRWCQGNMQHLAVLPARGLHWVSRLHLLTGVGSYLTAPLWLMFLLLGILISLQAEFVRPDYFPKGFSLFPQWPSQDPVRAAWVFVGTMGLLIIPKLLAYLLLLSQGSLRRGFGGALRTWMGILVEIVISGLIAPVMMIFQSTAVADIALGRDAGWQVQRRDDGGVARAELIRKYTTPTLFGVAMAASAYAVSLPLVLWMTPVIIGLLLAVPIAMLTSAGGKPGTRHWLFATPEDLAPPAVLVRANELARSGADGAASEAVAALGLLRADARLLAAHSALLPATSERKRGEIAPDLAMARAKIADAEYFDEAVGFLTKREIFAALGDRDTLDRLMALRQLHQYERQMNASADTVR